MSVLAENDTKHTLSEPRVWVQRVSVFRSLAPISEIRSIPFRTGVNIVWGIEEEATNNTPFEPGHGVGKTTLCRLIRYCLGESTFGQSSTVDEVRRTFPSGYVVAEVRIQGVNWSVARPFAKHHVSFAQQGVSIEELIKTEAREASFDHFTNALRTCALSGLCSNEILSDGSSLHWEHILSMCSRDQETRYQSLWNWRSERSDSKLKSYDLPKKVDAFLCIRTILGLLSAEEVSSRADVRQKTSELKALEGSIYTKRQEPEFTIKHLRRNLAVRLNCDEADVASLDQSDLLGLPRIVKDRAKVLQDELDALLPTIDNLNRQIRVTIARITEPREMIAAPLAEIVRLKRVAQLLSGMTSDDEHYRQEMDAIEVLPCKYGKVRFGQCSHIQQELERIDEKNQEYSSKNARDIVQSEDDAATLEAEIKDKEAFVKTNNQVLKDLESERNTLIGKQKQLEDQLKELQETLKGIWEQETILSGQAEETDLAALTKAKSDIEKDLKTAKDKLTEISAKLRETEIPVKKIFQAIIKAVLSKDYVGAVKFSIDEIEFTIKRRRSLSGEAFQTLGILLADIALLLTGSIGISNHPCFLIHDSPREADLGINIYRHFISTISALGDELRTSEHSPFQYIVTTTTPPPEGLRDGAYKLGAKHGTLLVDPLIVSDEEQKTLYFGN